MAQADRLPQIQAPAGQPLALRHEGVDRGGHVLTGLRPAASAVTPHADAAVLDVGRRETTADQIHRQWPAELNPKASPPEPAAPDHHDRPRLRPDRHSQLDELARLRTV